jgi:hypothetical protein
MRCGDVVRCGGQTAQFFLRLDYRIPSAANFLHVANMPSAAARMRLCRARQRAGLVRLPVLVDEVGLEVLLARHGLLRGGWSARNLAETL